MYCSHCGQKANDQDKYCSFCGEELLPILNHCPNCGEEIDVSMKYCKHCGYELPSVYKQARSHKSKIVAGILGIFIGGLGIHNFYIGETSKGVIQLCLYFGGIFTFGLTSIIASIWGLIEGIFILIGRISLDGDGYPME